MINKYIDYLRNEVYEHLLILKDGLCVLDIKGDFESVGVNESDLYLLKDALLLHNHPKGSTFSVSDVYNTMKYGAKKMLLVTPYFLYEIECRKGDWGFDVEKLQEIVNEVDSWANEEIDKLVIKENIKRDEANLEKSHYIWLAISNVYGFEYKRKEIK